MGRTTAASAPLNVFIRINRGLFITSSCINRLKNILNIYFSIIMCLDFIYMSIAINEGRLVRRPSFIWPIIGGFVCLRHAAISRG